MKSWLLRAMLGLAICVGFAPGLQANEVLFGINSNWLVLKDEERSEVLTLRIFGRWIDGTVTDGSNTNIVNLDCSTHGAIVRFSLPTGLWGRLGRFDIGDGQRASLAFAEPVATGPRALGTPLPMRAARNELVSADLELNPRSPLFQPARANLLLRISSSGRSFDFRLEKRDAIDQMIKQSLRGQNVPLAEYSDVEAYALCAEHIQFVRTSQRRIDAERGRQFPLPRLTPGTPYTTARASLIRLGWSPIIADKADWCAPNDERCEGRPEMVACAGTGLAQCAFAWQRGATTMHVFTQGEGANNGVTGARCEAGCGRR